MLKIDLTTIILQAINFIVLAVLLYYLLFRKILRQADERKRAAEAVQLETLRNLEESQNKRTEADEYLQSIQKKLDDMVEEAKMKVQDNAALTLEDTRLEAEEVYNQKRADLIRMQRRILKRAKSEILNTIREVALHSLLMTVPEEVHHKLVQQIFESVWDLGKKDMKRVNALRKSLSERDSVLLIETAKPLTKEEQNLAIRTFSALADRNITIELIHKEDLVAGMRVRLGDLVMDNSLANKLEEISENTASVFDEKLEKLQIK